MHVAGTGKQQAAPAEKLRPLAKQLSFLLKRFTTDTVPWDWATLDDEGGDTPTMPTLHDSSCG